MRAVRLVWWLVALAVCVSTGHLVLWMAVEQTSQGAAQVQHMKEVAAAKPERDRLDSDSSPLPATTASLESAESLDFTYRAGPMSPTAHAVESSTLLAADETPVTGPAAPVHPLDVPLLLAQPSRKEVLVHARGLTRAARSHGDEDTESWAELRCPRRLLLPTWMKIASRLPRATEELVYWTAPGLSHLRMATLSASQVSWQTCLFCKPADIAAIYTSASFDSFDLFVDEENKQVLLLASLLWSECTWPVLVLAYTSNGLDFEYLSRTELYCDSVLPHSVSVSLVGDNIVMLARQGSGQVFRAARLRAPLSGGALDIDWGAHLPATNRLDASLWCVGQFCYVFFAEDTYPGIYTRLFHLAGRPFQEWFSLLSQVASFEMVLPSEWFELLEYGTTTSDVSTGTLAWPAITADSTAEQVILSYAAGGNAVVEVTLLVVQEELTPSLSSATWCTQAQLLQLISSPVCMRLRKSRLPLPHDCLIGVEGESRCEHKEAVPLVTGTGRSGTSFVAKLLQGLGFSVAHDSVQSCPKKNCADLDAAVSWVHLFAETAECRVPSWSYHADCFTTVVHLVREPLASIQSRAFGRPLTQQIQAWIGCFVDTSGVGVHETQLNREAFPLFALRSWVLWNSFAHAVSSELFLLEELVSSVADVVRLVTVLFGEERTGAVTQQNWDSANAGGAVNQHFLELGVPLTWIEFFEMDEMAASMAIQLALRFGYQYTNHTREGVGLGDVAESDTILQPFNDGVRLQLGETISCWEAFDPLSCCEFLPPTGLWGCAIAKLSCP